MPNSLEIRSCENTVKPQTDINSALIGVPVAILDLTCRGSVIVLYGHNIRGILGGLGCNPQDFCNFRLENGLKLMLKC